jgi:hypothetical protein
MTIDGRDRFLILGANSAHVSGGDGDNRVSVTSLPNDEAVRLFLEWLNDERALEAERTAELAILERDGNAKFRRSKIIVLPGRTAQ